MPEYYFCSYNEIQRLAAVSKLHKKGYEYAGDKTLNSYREFPASTNPYVVTCGSLIFVVTPENFRRFRRNAIELTSLKQIDNLPYYGVDIVFPEPVKYNITYQKTNNAEPETYIISNPIDANKESFTCYCYGSGIQTFKKQKVRSFSKLN